MRKTRTSKGRELCDLLLAKLTKSHTGMKHFLNVICAHLARFKLAGGSVGEQGDDVGIQGVEICG